MVIVISNKLKNVIDSSKLADANCKYAIGCYSADDCIRTLSEYDIDYLVLDITALKDAFELGTWKKFRDFFDPTKTIILLDETKSYSNFEFLSMLITMGFYNFTKTGEGILKLMQYPNAYQDVSKYQQMAISMEDKREKEEEQIFDYQRKLEEKQEMMKEYLEKYQSGELDVPNRKFNVFKIQLQSALILTFLTFISSFLIYLLEVLISNFVPATDDYVGEYLYGSLANTEFTPLIIIGILLVLVIFAVYYSFLNAKIKSMQMTRGKFIIVPFAIYCMVIFGEYYFIGIFEKLYQLVMFFPIENKTYLYQDFYGLSRWIATAAIVLFYVKILINNSKTFKYEIDLSQKFTVIEKAWVLDLILMLVVPLAYQISRVLPDTNVIYQMFSTIYDKPLAMMILTGIGFILMILILLQPKFMKEKEYTILKEEDL